MHAEKTKHNTDGEIRVGRRNYNAEKGEDEETRMEDSWARRG